VSISPRAKLRVGLGGAAKLLGQPERRQSRGAVRVKGLLRVRKHPTGQKRQDVEVGDQAARGLLECVLPHFERWPLMSRKHHDFERFASVCRLMAAGGHRSQTGLAQIVELARGMNPSGRRRYDAAVVLETLQGEEIVCASGNGGGTRSSDLHEWRNDLGAVSTRDPVKL
jgi:hypothetical protein